VSTAARDRFEATVAYRVRFDESNAKGVLRTAGLLRFAQDAAWIHSERLGFDREWYASRGLWWVVRCAEVLVRDDIPMGETLDVTTRVVGYRKVWARRQTEVSHPSGDVAATLLTDWVITDGRGTPTRLPAAFLDLFGTLMAPFTPGRVVLPPLAAGDARTRTFAVRPQDLDPLAHVNNAAYLDYIEESLVEAGQAAWLERAPRRYRLEYAAAAEPGETLTARLWPTANGFACRLERADGSDLVRATLDRDASRQAFRDQVRSGRTG
jgi:acyl-ACP thioesterase